MTNIKKPDLSVVCDSHKTTEHYQTQWYKADEKRWINSGGWHESMSLDMAREWLARDQAYFYKRIPLRIIKVTTEVVEMSNGLQEI